MKCYRGSNQGPIIRKRSYRLNALSVQTWLVIFCPAIQKMPVLPASSGTYRVSRPFDTYLTTGWTICQTSSTGSEFERPFRNYHQSSVHRKPGPVGHPKCDDRVLRLLINQYSWSNVSMGIYPFWSDFSSISTTRAVRAHSLNFRPFSHSWYFSAIR